MKRTALSRGDSELARTTALRKRNPERHDKEWARTFHSEEFVVWTHGRPCVCRGKGAAWGCKGGPSQVSHDPTRGAGGTWKNTHPASPECHTKIGAGAETFWRLIGRTREEANREHHGAWLDHCEESASEREYGLPDEFFRDNPR